MGGPELVWVIIQEKNLFGERGKGELAWRTEGGLNPLVKG